MLKALHLAPSAFQFLYGTINGPLNDIENLSVNLFQFLYGTINGTSHPLSVVPVIIFQFLYGTINGQQPLIVQRKQVHFNSYMVRLMDRRGDKRTS